MSDFNLSSNMNLPIPVVGVAPGPEYATNVNNALTLVDQHDHSPGYGVPITPAGMDINVALNFSLNGAQNVAYVNLTPQITPPSVGSIYESGVDLYYIDGLGNEIQITANGAVAGTPGSIANLVAPASASYVAGSSSFVWQSDTNIAADMDFGAAIMRNLSPNSTFALTLQPPTLSNNYSITLPTLPLASKIMTIGATGIISAVTDVDNSTIQISSNNIGIKNSGVGTNQIADLNVTTIKIADEAVTNDKLADDIVFNEYELIVPVAAAGTVACASTAQRTLSGTTAIDGVSLTSGVTRVLLKNQTNAAENGVWVANSGAWTRATDYDTVAELNFAGVAVSGGTVNGGKSYFQNNYLLSMTSLQSWSTSSTQEYIVPDTSNFIVITGVGGGGGGGGGGREGGFSGSGGSGGGGSVPATKILAVTPGESLSITLGKGGTGGAAQGVSGAAGNAGTAGAETIIRRNSTNTIIFQAEGGILGAGSAGAITASTWHPTTSSTAAGIGGAATSGASGDDSFFANGGLGGTGASGRGGGGGGGAGYGNGGNAGNRFARTFVITPASTIDANNIYTDSNGNQCFVNTAISSSTSLSMTCVSSSSPAAAGTLTWLSGPTPGDITYTSFAAGATTINNGAPGEYGAGGGGGASGSQQSGDGGAAGGNGGDGVVLIGTIGKA